ncbi:MAG: F0F1 ATP synthase subunit delta [Candidatus Pacebacteria bacterium]|nr:F0F1 ATP synthase subunit delta [Candidatus Paceibacterota bacterium]
MNTKKYISNLAEALFLAQEGKKEEEKNKLAENLRRILKERKKEYLLPKVIEKFEEMISRRQRIKLFLAKDQKSDLIKKIKSFLSEKFKGKEVDIIIDQNLIGGFRVKTENVLIKASVKDFLNEFKTCL